MVPPPRDIVLRDKRTLRVSEGGEPDGKPVFVLHTCPGSSRLYTQHVTDAARRGLRLISYDRAGYGGSTQRPGRAVIDEASDVRAVADHLGIERFALWGHSKGGSCALACAAALPDRAIAIASLAAVAPFSADGLDWFDGAPEDVIAGFRLQKSDPAAWRRQLVADVEEMKEISEGALRESLLRSSSESDRTVLTPDLIAFARAQMREGLSQGPEGFIDDCLSDIRPWGFELDAIEIPVQLWHGLDDHLVPLSHAKWLAAHLPHAEIHLEPGEGHISLFARRIPEVHEWLASRF
jgi:pimeloyl-ACP methyl ester carboxylesterase